MIRRQYSYNTDIYSAGIINYILLTLKMPFFGRTDQEIIEQIEKCKDVTNGKTKIRNNFSMHGMDFMKKCIVVDWKVRM